MMKITILVSLFCLLPLLINAQQEFPCGTTQPADSQYITTYNQYASNREVLTIPVIFHVVWRTEEQNIAGHQIESQMEVLNADFRALNDQSNVPVGFQDNIGDTEIEFCLARRLPNGQSTAGIIRTETQETIIGLKQALYTTSPAVDSEHYLNVWVADLGGGLNGIASFPGEDLPEQDGIIIDPNFVGTTGLAANAQPYHLGRTLTHEVGHYLNLFHVFGTTTSGNCATDDFVEDTPNSQNTYLGECPTGIEFSCESSDMWMNYMYFTDDECMSMFTEGQKARMHETLLNERIGLTQSEGCLIVGTSEIEKDLSNIFVYPNPTKSFLNIEIQGDYPTDKNLQLFSNAGFLLKEFSFAERDFAINLEDFSQGMYYLRVKGTGKVKSFVILR